MASVEKKRRKKSGVPKVVAPTLPPELSYLWNAFVRLSERRGGGMGPLPISFADIHWFCRVHHERYELWEVDAITALDDAYFASTRAEGN